MNASRTRRLIVALYPEHFRDRYCDELMALAEDCGRGWRVTLDLVLSALKARLRAEFDISVPEGRRLRLQTTTSTVFAFWAWSAVAVAVFARAVDDQPVPGLRSWGWSAYEVGNVIFTLSVVLVLVTGFVFWLRVVAPAVASRDRRILVPAALPAAVVLLWLACTGLVALGAHRIRPGNYRHIMAQGPDTAAGWALLVGYAIFTLVCVGVCTAGAQRALKRARLPERTLRASSIVATGATIALGSVTICAAVCLARVLAIGGLSARDELTAVAPVCFLAAATVSAAVSSARGMRAIGAT